MRIVLEVVSSADGVLTGSVEWSGGGSARPFHGALELLAILEAAVADHVEPDPPDEDETR